MDGGKLAERFELWQKQAIYTYIFFATWKQRTWKTKQNEKTKFDQAREEAFWVTHITTRFHRLRAQHWSPRDERVTSRRSTRRYPASFTVHSFHREMDRRLDWIIARTRADSERVKVWVRDRRQATTRRHGKTRNMSVVSMRVQYGH